MKLNIYLDNNATTAVDPKVIDAIVLNLKNSFGNPSSTHSVGQEAKKQLQMARDAIAACLKVSHREIIFTSGATESLNLVLRGLLTDAKTHVITSDLEHAAVYSTLKQLESESVLVSYLKGGAYGAVTLEDVKKAYRPETGLIVLMAVNNETGVKTDIEAIGAFAKEKGIAFVVDGVAILGKEPFVISDGITAACFSGHKLHAPKGIGFAFIRKNVKLKPFITGGDQEFGKRGGTENITGIIALKEALNLALNDIEANSEKMKRLRDKLESKIMQSLPQVSINGEDPRIVNTTNLMFRGIDGELLMTLLDKEGIAVSMGSACASGALEPSRVLLNMGLSIDEASSSLRFSLSRFTTEEEIDQTIEAVVRIVSTLTR